jgi:hypothetical protein
VVEILKKPKNAKNAVDFRPFGFFSLGVPSGGVGGCYGDGRGVYFAAGWGLVVENAKYVVDFAFLESFGVSVAQKSS